MTKKEEKVAEIKSQIETKLKNLEKVRDTLSQLETEYEAVLAPLRPVLDKLQTKIDKGSELEKGLQEDILTLSSKEEVAGEIIQSSSLEIKFKKHTFRDYQDEKAIIKFLEEKGKEELLKREPVLKKNEFVTWYEKESAKSDETTSFEVPGFELREGLKPSIAEKKIKKAKK